MHGLFLQKIKKVLQLPVPYQNYLNESNRKQNTKYG